LAFSAVVTGRIRTATWGLPRDGPAVMARHSTGTRQGQL